MLKVEFLQIENVVCGKILEQVIPQITPEEDSDVIFVATNDFLIRQLTFPEIVVANKSMSLYIGGRSEQFNDSVFCMDLGTPEIAAEYITKATQAIEEFNHSYQNKTEESSPMKILHFLAE